eukprot:366095-Chlamydomonas_euryale.AAC.6
MCDGACWSPVGLVYMHAFMHAGAPVQQAVYAACMHASPSHNTDMSHVRWLYRAPKNCSPTVRELLSKEFWPNRLHTRMLLATSIGATQSLFDSHTRMPPHTHTRTGRRPDVQVLTGTDAVSPRLRSSGNPRAAEALLPTWLGDAAASVPATPRWH